MPWRSPPRRPLRLAWLCLLFLLLSGGPSRAAAGEAPVAPADSAALPDPAALPWRLTKEGSFTATQFLLAQLYGGATPEFLAFGREVLGEGLTVVLVHALDAPQHPSWEWNFPAYQGGLAGWGDLEGDGTEELIFWRYDAGRKRLGFWLERLRRNDAGGIESDTLLVCAEIAVGHEGMDHEHLPRSHPEGRILAAEGRILVSVTAGFNWRSAARGLLVYDLQGALRTQIRLPNNTLGYRFADLDGDARRELFLSCYASGNGDSCARGDDAHSYWRVLDLEGRDRLNVEAGGFATMATTQPLRPSAQALPLVLASLGRSQADELRLYDGEGLLVRARPLPGAMAGPPLVTDLDRDGAEEILVGLADGSLLHLDARLEERTRWRLPAATQPLSAADLTGDARPELVLRVGDELLVCAADLAPLARWTGWLNERLSNPLIQVNTWQGEDGRPRLALVGLLPNQVGMLRLEPNPVPDGDEPWLAIAAGLLVLAGAAIVWLARERLRLKRRLRAGAWIDLGPAQAPGRADPERDLQELYRGLRGFDHGNDGIDRLTSLSIRIGRLRSQDSVVHRQLLQRAAAEVQAVLPDLLALAPLARRVLGDDFEVDRAVGDAGMLLDALAALEASVDRRAYILDRAKSLEQSCSALIEQLQALHRLVAGRVEKPVLRLLLDALPELQGLAGSAGAPLELALAGPLGRGRPRLAPEEFTGILKSLVEIGLTRIPAGSRVPLRLGLSVQEDFLHLAVETPGGSDAETTAARWQAFPGRDLKYGDARREGDALRLRLPLRGEGVVTAQARGAAAGLLTLLALLTLAPAVGSANPVRPLPHRFQALDAITFDPAATAQLLCRDLEDDRRANAVLLLRAEATQASWLLVQRDQGHAWVDSVALAGSGSWSLVGAEDLEADGRAEILLSRWLPGTLELRRLPLPPSATAASADLLFALPLASRLAPGVPAPRFNQVSRLPAGDGFAFAYALGSPGSPAGIVAYSPAQGRLWQRELSGAARLEDLADLDADGSRELLVAVAAGEPSPAAPLPGPASASWCLDLDGQGATLRREACGESGSRLSRHLLRQVDGLVLGELRLLQPTPASAQGTRVEYRPAGGAPPLVLEPTWRAQDVAVLDLDGDGREEFVLATGGFATGRGELIAYDRQLQEVQRLSLPGRPRALHRADFTGDGPSQLLVVLPDDLLLVDRQFARLARLREVPSGVQDIRQLALYPRPKGRSGIAVLSAGQLLLLHVEPSRGTGRPGVAERLAWIALGVPLSLALGLALPRLRGRGRQSTWRSEGPWQPRARLLGLLLDFRCRERGAERIVALRASCLLAADGDAAAAQQAGAARAALPPRLAPLLAALSQDVEPIAHRLLRGLLARSTGSLEAEEWRRLARDLDRLGSRLCSLELQLARRLSADPVAGFQGALTRGLREHPPLDELSLSIPGGRVPPVFFEPAQLGIVFENLIGNACDGMAASPRRCLYLGLEARGDRLRLLLEDSGSGVETGMEARIFEPGVSTHGPGRGQGLVIVRDLLGAFGGRIVCLPGPGSLGGARFELQLRLLGELS